MYSKLEESCSGTVGCLGRSAFLSQGKCWRDWLWFPLPQGEYWTLIAKYVFRIQESFLTAPSPVPRITHLLQRKNPQPSFCGFMILCMEQTTDKPGLAFISLHDFCIRRNLFGPIPSSSSRSHLPRASRQASLGKGSLRPIFIMHLTSFFFGCRLAHIFSRPSLRAPFPLKHAGQPP